MNLIHLFDFYLALAFLLSTAMRVHQYRAVIGLVRAVPDRWPNLLKLVRQHIGVFLTWSTVLPLFLAFMLSVIHTLATRLVWPHAHLTLVDLFHHWRLLLIIAPLCAAMLAVDVYSTFKVGEFDREMMQKYFDQAEFWLRSWAAPVVRVFTFGYINPRKMVTVEVRKALIEASKLLNSTLWWVSVQVALRVAFGLALWMTWAYTLSSGAVG